MNPRRNSYVGGICDYTKATECKKTTCAYITGNKNGCRFTTNPKWIKKGDKHDNTSNTDK